MGRRVSGDRSPGKQQAQESRNQEQERTVNADPNTANTANSLFEENIEELISLTV